MSVRKALAWFPAAAFRGIGPLALAQAFTVGCGLLVTIAWTRLMPQEMFGEFRIVLAMHSFAGGFCLLGIGHAAVMSAASNKDGNLLRLVWMKVLANVFGATLIAGSAIYYSWSLTGSSALVTALLAAAILFPLYNLSDLWISWLNGKSRFDLLSFGKILMGAFPLVVVASAAALRIFELCVIVLFVMALVAVLNVMLLVLVIRRLQNDDRDSTINNFGSHSSVALLVSSLMSIDILVLNHFYSVADVAIYAIVTQFPPLAKAVASIFGQLLSPQIYRAQSPWEAWQTIRRPFILLTLGFFGLGVVGFLVIEPAIELLFPATYAPAAAYSRWLWLVGCSTGSTNLLGMILLGTKRPLFLYAPYIGYPVTLAALYFLLGSQGLDGLVMARIIAMIGLAGFYVGGLLLHLRTIRLGAKHA
jgi:O-antigen/teichoic acid export membrane protein